MFKGRVLAIGIAVSLCIINIASAGAVAADTDTIKAYAPSGQRNAADTGDYINKKYGFSLRIPPIWENHVRIIERYDAQGKIKCQVDYKFLSGFSAEKYDLFTVYVMTSEDRAKTGEEAGAPGEIKLAEKNGYVYIGVIADKNPFDSSSEAGKLFTKAKEALDGIDDLFKTPEDTDNTQVFGKYFHEGGKWMEADIHLPVISGLADVEYQEQLNREMEAEAMKEKENMTKQAGEYALIAEKQGWPVRPYSLTVDYSVKANTPEILSFTVTTYPFTGGTGATRIDYYNIDKKQNRILKLEDLFVDGADYIATINGEISAQIAAREENGQGAYFKGEEGFKTVGAEQGFYIADGELVIGFPKYSIAPGYMGNPEFNLSLEAQKELLRDPALYSREFGILDKEIRAASGAMDLHMRLPVIHGMKDREYQQKINRLIMEQALKDRQAVEAQADKHLTEAQESGVKPAPYELTGGYTLEMQDGCYSLNIHTIVTTQTEPDAVVRQDGYALVPGLEGKSGAGWPEAPVVINGKPVGAEGAFAYMSSENTLMLPLRKVAEALEYTVEYRPETNSIEMIAEDGRKAVVMLDSQYSLFPHTVIFSQAAPELIHDSAYVPAGYISWAFGAEVRIHQNGSVEITSK